MDVQNLLGRIRAHESDRGIAEMTLNPPSP